MGARPQKRVRLADFRVWRETAGDLEIFVFFRIDNGRGIVRHAHALQAVAGDFRDQHARRHALDVFKLQRKFHFPRGEAFPFPAGAHVLRQIQIEHPPRIALSVDVGSYVHGVFRAVELYGNGLHAGERAVAAAHAVADQAAVSAAGADLVILRVVRERAPVVIDVDERPCGVAALFGMGLHGDDDAVRAVVHVRQGDAHGELRVIAAVGVRNELQKVVVLREVADVDMVFIRDRGRGGRTDEHRRFPRLLGVFGNGEIPLQFVEFRTVEKHIVRVDRRNGKGCRSNFSVLFVAVGDDVIARLFEHERPVAADFHRLLRGGNHRERRGFVAVFIYAERFGHAERRAAARRGGSFLHHEGNALFHGEGVRRFRNVEPENVDRRIDHGIFARRFGHVRVFFPRVFESRYRNAVLYDGYVARHGAAVRETQRGMRAVSRQGNGFKGNVFRRGVFPRDLRKGNFRYGGKTFHDVTLNGYVGFRRGGIRRRVGDDVFPRLLRNEGVVFHRHIRPRSGLYRDVVIGDRPVLVIDDDRHGQRIGKALQSVAFQFRGNGGPAGIGKRGEVFVTLIADGLQQEGNRIPRNIHKFHPHLHFAGGKEVLGKRGGVLFFQPPPRFAVRQKGNGF